ncbi:DUF3641 domain-containing protein [Thauera chlorobenzoica]|uniref:Uncharacterized protein n=1 Tax=Thauera chlorobenzoica TaxID=96773 RepID=A0A1H5XFP7_9RHOO|nr:DUF3641 domain-containing protein [Thauera chlorobenzoica]APR05550.1 hypothetical protein Tchl_2726 [Thauera chlorobenzoica]SEG10529.1 Protein of unknown function [Thauera chlorobenzoica]
MHPTFPLPAVTDFPRIRRGTIDTTLQVNLGYRFNQLFTIANMPIKRFASALVSKGQFAGYLKTLHEAHRVDKLAAVMCRNLVSVDGWGATTGGPARRGVAGAGR